MNQALQLSSQGVQDLTARASAILLLNISIGAGVAASVIAVWSNVDHSLLISLTPAALAALVGTLQCLRALYPVQSEDLNFASVDDLTQDALRSRLSRSGRRLSIIAERLRAAINELAIGLSATLVLLMYQVIALGTRDHLLSNRDTMTFVDISTVSIAVLAVVARVLDRRDRRWPAAIGAWIAWTPRLTSSLIMQTYTPIFFVLTLLNIISWLTLLGMAISILESPSTNSYSIPINGGALIVSIVATYGFSRLGYRRMPASTARFMSMTALLILELAALVIAWLILRSM